MNKERIVELVHEGHLENYIAVYTTAGMFKGIWYAVDTHTETIEIKEEGINNIVSMESIIAISYPGRQE